MVSIVRRLLATGCLASACAGTAVWGQETFQYVGGAGVQAWENSANWTGGSGDFSSFPGESPAAGTLDSADLTGSRSDDLAMVISAPGIELADLRLGSTQFAFVETVVSGTPGASLAVDTIESAGTVISLNRIDVTLLLERDLDIAGANSLTISGAIVNSAPTQGAFRDVVNDTDGTLKVEGNVVLSDDATNYGHLRFINNGISRTAIAGIISDGDAPGGRVTFARGEFDMLSESTYTGVTQLGENDPNVGSVHVIHTDRPFGLGRLVIGGGNELKIIRSAFGKGARTLDNDIQIAREVAFEGGENVVLNGTVYQSNGRRLTNNIALTRSLTINGDIYAADSLDVREWSFDGLGITVVNGIIDDSLGHPELTGASVAKRGSGRTIWTNPAVAAYGGQTRIVAGTLQLGAGGAAVNLNGQQVTGAGVLEINHGEVMTFNAPLNDSVALHHLGPGTTRLERVSATNGDVLVSGGTLLVNAGDGITSGTGTATVTVEGGTLGGTGHVAGPVNVAASGSLAPGESTGTLSVGELSLAAGSVLEIEIGGTTAGEFDRVQVGGDASLGGASLQVSLLEHLTLTPGMTLEVVDVPGTLTGQFAGLDEGAMVGSFGADLFVSYAGGDGNDVVLYAPPALNGDVDADGDVDGEDFLVWQRGGTQPVLDAELLVGWKASYGAASGEAPQAATIAPEPTCWALACCGAALYGGRRTLARSRPQSWR